MAKIAQTKEKSLDLKKLENELGIKISNLDDDNET